MRGLYIRRGAISSSCGRPATRPPHRTRPHRATRLAYVETYGCQMNVADTDMVLGMLQRAGYGRTEDPARADLILINTCAVREKAEERVFARASILAHKKARPDTVLGHHRLHGRAPQGQDSRRACRASIW